MVGILACDACQCMFNTVGIEWVLTKSERRGEASEWCLCSMSVHGGGWGEAMLDC